MTLETAKKIAATLGGATAEVLVAKLITEAAERADVNDVDIKSTIVLNSCAKKAKLQSSHNSNTKCQMRADRFNTLKSFDLINVENGRPVPILVGTKAFLEPATIKEREYLLLKDTRIGSVTSFYETLERDGKIKLFRIAEANDPTLDGITLPIRSGSQLSEHQRTHLVCGHLVRGKFLCTKCTLDEGLAYPDAIAVYPINILPYSQLCSNCGLVVFDIWQSKKGGPLSLFN